MFDQNEAALGSKEEGEDCWEEVDDSLEEKDGKLCGKVCLSSFPSLEMSFMKYQLTLENKTKHTQTPHLTDFAIILTGGGDGPEICSSEQVEIWTWDTIASIALIPTAIAVVFVVCVAYNIQVTRAERSEFNVIRKKLNSNSSV